MICRTARVPWAMLVILVAAGLPAPGAAVPDVRMLPSDAPPEILAVEIPGPTVYCGQTVTGSVVASSNVASVELRVRSYSRVMQKVAPGRFTITLTVPQLPSALLGAYAIEVIARNTRGDAVREHLRVTVRSRGGAR